MAQRRWLAKMLMFLALEVGALVGVPLRPDDIEQISRLMHRTVAVEVLERDDEGDPPD